MADIAWLADEVENGPYGPRIGAFFDFDGTLIDGYSALAFFRARIKSRDMDAKELLQTLIASIDMERRGADVSQLMEIGVKAQAGKTIAELDELGRKIFQNKISGMIYPDARILLDAHRRMGHTIVLASSATAPQLLSAAADLGINHILCTEIATNPDGVVTGVVRGPIRWGKGKADAVKDFAAQHKLNLDLSYAYSNGAEDVPFLKQVGNPRPLNPDDDLKKIAKKNGWPIAYLSMPHRHNPITVARSVAAIGSFGVGIAAGFAMALINRDRSIGAAIAASVGSDLALAMAGVKLNVHGEQHLWSDRPCVFLFNHQSQLDVMVLGALLRRDFTGVAKKSLEHDPVFGPIGYLTDVAYVDRSNSSAARAALEPVVEALKRGKSIAISPEGTRSPTPRLLPFKKGAFHMALQAGVPVVPIVMRNAGDLMRPHSLIVSSGTIDVAVLPPVDSSKWTPADIGTAVDQVRKMYLDTLANWPTD